MHPWSRSKLLAGLFLLLAGSGSDASVVEPVSGEADREVSVAARPAPPSSSSATVSVRNSCEITVTYTWSGLKGRNLIASAGVFYRGNGGLDVGVANFNFEGQVGAGGSVSHTFTLTANATTGRQLLGRGDLVDSRKYQRVDGSAAASGTFFSTCG